MSEEFLHYIWKFRNFTVLGLHTDDGEPVSIISPGVHNHDSGPDFSDARIQIGEQLWAGNVELHVRASDWNRHQHQHDEAYDNVILHVVYENDAEIKTKEGGVIPTLVLKGLFDEMLYWRYEQLVQTKNEIPCAEHFASVDAIIKESMLDRVLVERIEQKSNLIETIWEKNNRDFNETFYQWMAYGFGLKVNAEPMLVLARSVPQKVLAKHKDSIFQLEALLYGVAGLLQDNKDDYAVELNKEFQFLKKKYKLQELKPSIWKYARLRPPSFPEVRIAQFAMLITRSDNLFSKILGNGSLTVLEQLLSYSPSMYWREHYRFGKEHNRSSAAMGTMFQQTLIINVIVPFLFVYATLKAEPFYKQRAIDILDQMKAEDNKITRVFTNLGLEMNSAYQTQAAIQLYNAYCSPKKCLNCSLGIQLIKRK